MSESTHILDLTSCKPKDLPPFVEEGDPLTVRFRHIEGTFNYEISQDEMDKNVYARWREFWIKSNARAAGAPSGLIRRQFKEAEMFIHEPSLPAGARIVPIKLWEEWQSDNQDS